MVRSFRVLLFSVVLSVVAKAQEPVECPYDKIPPKKLNGYILRIIQLREDEWLRRDARCIATVISNSKERTVVGKDWSISVNEVTGTDLNGDGVPEAVFEGYSGGAHCCWTYWIVSLGDRVERLAKLYNERPIAFKKSNNKVSILETLDGAFDYFDGLCHACTVFPLVFLELRDRRFHDVGKQFIADYDKEITEARQELSDGELQKFRSLPAYDNSARAGFSHTVQPVLRIVLGYLYSGREGQAWKALDEMWPASDRKRIKKLILETRSEGILSQITARTHADKRSGGK